MKKLLVAIAFAAVASSASALVAGGPHDMQLQGGNLSACQYCHAPHWSNSTVANAPLWNRDFSAAAYTPYSTNNVPGVAAYNANSQTCLSCHDGTVAIGDLFGTNEEVATNAVFVTGTAMLGTDLRNDHPVSIPYAGADLEAIGTIQTTLKLYGAGETMVECASCHEPHTDTQPNFLRIGADVLCTTCHLK